MAENAAENVSPLTPHRSQRLCSLIAIETSGSSGSVAWAQGDQVRRAITLDPTRRTAATLTAALSELLAAARDQPCPVDVVAVANGPGSFTGLRIGVTAAKMLAYALKCRLVAVDTLAAMAGAVWKAQPQCNEACVAINAYRRQLFIARWSRLRWGAAAQENGLAEPSQVWSAADWQATIAQREPGLALAADPAVVRMVQRTDAAAAGSLLSLSPDASDIAQLGLRLAHHGHFVSPLELKPNYLRDSAAEEKLR